MLKPQSPGLASIRPILLDHYNWMAAEDAKHDAEFILIREDENYIGKRSATIPASGESRPLFNVNARIDKADGKQRLLLTVAGMHGLDQRRKVAR